MGFQLQVLPTSEQFDPNAYLGFMHAVRTYDARQLPGLLPVIRSAVQQVASGEAALSLSWQRRSRPSRSCG